MLGLPGINARNNTPCFAPSMSSKISERSGGVGAGFVPDRGTDFCGVLGENQACSSPLGFPSLSVSGCDLPAVLPAVRRSFACNWDGTPPAASESFFKRFQ